MSPLPLLDGRWLLGSLGLGALRPASLHNEVDQVARADDGERRPDGMALDESNSDGGAPREYGALDVRGGDGR